MRVGPPHASATQPAEAGDVSAQAIVPVPQWCVAGGRITGTRSEACAVYSVTYTTERIVNGQVQTTGVLLMDAFSYTYSSVSLPGWVHQFQLVSRAVGSWGDAVRASVSGTATSTGACRTARSSFPAQPVTPFNTFRSGEGSFTTTATAVNAVGRCKTTWNIVFTNAGYTNAPLPPQSLDEIRCDNATGANLSRPRRVGCAVYWYASAVNYSRSRNPSLAQHVAEAQGSGLPGATFAAPLTRTTNNSIINTNRSRACGDAPSITGRQCDEYPLATTRQGLSAGGTRRTFPDCNINAPTGRTGPTGASACMIAAGDNSAQGALMAAFYYDWRVLDGDPYRVLVVS